MPNLESPSQAYSPSTAPALEPNSFQWRNFADTTWDLEEIPKVRESMKITFILLVSQHPAHIRTLSHHYQSKYHLSAVKAVISNLQGFLLPSCCAQQVQLRWVKKKNQHKVWIFGQKVSFHSPCANSAPPHYKDETRPDLFLKHKTWCTHSNKKGIFFPSLIQLTSVSRKVERVQWEVVTLIQLLPSLSQSRIWKLNRELKHQKPVT